ncbi:phosphoadenosine phosphosulfate reductase family protein [Rhizobium lentis]|uniref:3'-phosphoadenosine 5'-phosphosulfate sulfotransferase (PAPS reductase)/FAD synthetase n=1 Tax=Rhizobium lentis TaxID=1138194 RepID=A0A7W8XEF2_9HYPH|nr:phosphoadenosine phosphosulfate reductase family protein [Rhizobium lentis]MBB4574414.1 3'-phosphoadenosine 5'-phosphosulfate sulfotransferase (PAPS reductase)/FAD synthetase [Rhizobium lentis]MBB5550340.1 3'-phosphoadenosine 5'-phosphosulfate sulfotransferase (PAPS reductase)/FAD synthetase [Rhizobium lentis]MBB5560631.1 3'-phosphoadenosine 5'-phosphosulfate sulfotransferase (PAPS reductase)/FAD synthetase [Rhizobium lentis]MBB5567216.1 3'-phosphoadenosine 5'-phosphosulfate sulfotransferase
MKAIAIVTLVSDELAKDAPVAIGVSGGKDSQAAALATFRYLDSISHGGPRILVHSDLGVVEWDDSLPVCERLAKHLGAELLVVRRNAGDLMERWEARWRSSVERYEKLSTVTLVPCWSTPSMRFCTSELKTHVIRAALKRRYGGRLIVNVTGVRRDESSARAKASIADREAEQPIINWRPIVDWTVQDVFSAIDTSGVVLHPAYRDFGMSRVSCRFCIMSNIADLTAAAAQPESHDLFRRMVALESASSFAFQGARWLGDVAPHLLDEKSQRALATAKVKATERALFEKFITPSMLYVKGWPTRMLTDTEADILATTRQAISGILGFRSAHLDRASIHARYAELIADKAVRDARKRKVAA